ncbi:hypothetical protein KM043_002408 [Ampulex compressa]|nr:hypothetical protein KM043_002408 [Ampulex compressa]
MDLLFEHRGGAQRIFEGDDSRSKVVQRRCSSWKASPGVAEDANTLRLENELRSQGGGQRRDRLCERRDLDPRLGSMARGKSAIRGGASRKSSRQRESRRLGSVRMRAPNRGSRRVNAVGVEG